MGRGYIVKWMVKIIDINVNKALIGSEMYWPGVLHSHTRFSNQGLGAIFGCS